MLPGGFAVGEWLVLVKAAGQSPIGERRILVDCRRKQAPDRGTNLPIARRRRTAGSAPIADIVSINSCLTRYGLAGMMGK
ncbi:hypothetical protein ATN00_01970 [Sphingobium baderi]|uniref:Uncharacterized protein n=1 Tax=Sphingobium baderi TaxID=1332080 RepID=A0A0S3EV12_9SPHN|nr:hypothetical protein ATN00_01970 [Sphingobium baderi]